MCFEISVLAQSQCLRQEIFDRCTILIGNFNLQLCKETQIDTYYFRPCEGSSNEVRDFLAMN